MLCVSASAVTKGVRGARFHRRSIVGVIESMMPVTCLVWCRAIAVVLFPSAFCVYFSIPVGRGSWWLAAYSHGLGRAIAGRSRDGCRLRFLPGWGAVES